MTYSSLGCQPPNAAPYIYTPTAADVGMVTVSELANETTNGATYNIRNFPVYGTPPPAFTIAPCPTGNVQVTLTDATYDSYTVQVGATTLPITRNVPLTVPVTAGATTVVVTGHYAALNSCTGSATQNIFCHCPAGSGPFPNADLAAQRHRFVGRWRAAGGLQVFAAIPGTGQWHVCRYIEHQYHGQHYFTTHAARRGGGPLPDFQQ